MKSRGFWIGDIFFPKPIVGGALGPGLSINEYIWSLANLGCLATIPTVGLVDPSVHKKDFVEKSNQGLIEQIKFADEFAHNYVAVNVMEALANSEELIRTAVNNGSKIICGGAGLHLNLPAIVNDKSVNLVPIIGSVRVFNAIVKRWRQRSKRYPSAVIIEGVDAGAHLRPNLEEILNPEFSLEEILAQVKTAVQLLVKEIGYEIPIIVAGGIAIDEFAYWLSLGASAVQFGTLGLTTHECKTPLSFKNACIAAGPDDTVLFKSSVGLWARALDEPGEVARALKNGEKFKPECPYQCIEPCYWKETGFCLARVLLNAKYDRPHAVRFVGKRVDLVDRIWPMAELIATIMKHIEDSPLEYPS